MFWSESKREWQPHPDCTCGQADDWKRGKYRHCRCHFLRPLGMDGKPVEFPLMDELRAAHLRDWH